MSLNYLRSIRILKIRLFTVWNVFLLYCCFFGWQGDFAVLLTAGMSVKMALLANLFSAMSCYIGLAIGIYIGQQADIRFWIFAIAGGMFLYVALVDMLPDLMHSETLQTEPFVTFLVQNFGLLLGFSIMLIIALYEEDLMKVEF